MTKYQLVSVLKNGAPKRAAFCSTDYGLRDRQTCPGTRHNPWIKADAHWDTSFDKAPDDSPTLDVSDLWKYDPDIEPDVIKQPRMHDCLFAPIFPPRTG